jgi:hypothetical protein
VSPWLIITFRDLLQFTLQRRMILVIKIGISQNKQVGGGEEDFSSILALQEHRTQINSTFS